MPRFFSIHSLLPMGRLQFGTRLFPMTYMVGTIINRLLEELTQTSSFHNWQNNTECCRLGVDMELYIQLNLYVSYVQFRHNISNLYYKVVLSSMGINYIINSFIKIFFNKAWFSLLLYLSVFKCNQHSTGGKQTYYSQMIRFTIAVSRFRSLFLIHQCSLVSPNVVRHTFRNHLSICVNHFSLFLVISRKC